MSLRKPTGFQNHSSDAHLEQIEEYHLYVFPTLQERKYQGTEMIPAEPFLKYVKWDPDCAETKKMKFGLGRMPARMKFASIFAVMLLLPDVTSMSVYRSVETTDTTSASVTSAPKETTLDKYESETNETERDYNEVGLTPLDDSPEFYETVSPVKEENVPLLNTEKEETNEESQNNLDEFPEEINGPEANTDEVENLIGLDELNEAVDNALDLVRLLVKRDAGEEEEEEEDDDEADEPKMENIDEDEFSFSDLPRVFEPLIQAFSSSKSGPPSPDDFFSWLPALKDLLEPNEEPSASRPTGLPSDSVTRPERRSSFSTFPEPSLQIAPASPPAEPTKSDVLPSPSLLEELTTPVPPTAPLLQVYVFLWCLTMSSGHSEPGPSGAPGVPPVPKPDNPLVPVPEKPWPEGPPKPGGPQPLGPLVPGKPWPEGPPVSPDPRQPRSPQPPNPLGPTNPGPFPGPSKPPKPPLPDDPYLPFPLVPVAPWPPLPEWDDSGNPPEDPSGNS
ncbi:hypothetical protein JD844_013405 [Phrynosoma platyrhinos]|uniref:Uncharacterized protein n=1 Tax=Phrynosoma platyrhinos TaxID=52577 RepID=A0ABQ7TL78_PHRPL|nr:hypothetical protein JD844_013405 [Phrynosoma platyrhinos]